ncbi:MAG: hypothetical protein AAF378_10615 [Cyanobacteria bacterium P01_A01_bin.84]
MTLDSNHLSTDETVKLNEVLGRQTGIEADVNPVEESLTLQKLNLDGKIVKGQKSLLPHLQNFKSFGMSDFL